MDVTKTHRNGALMSIFRIGAPDAFYFQHQLAIELIDFMSAHYILHISMESFDQNNMPFPELTRDQGFLRRMGSRITDFVFGPMPALSREIFDAELDQAWREHGYPETPFFHTATSIPLQKRR